MPKYGYLVVELPHDIEIAYVILSVFGLSRVQREEELDNNLKPLVPRTFPHGGDLQKRVPVPLFLKSQSHVIAVHSPIGDSRLIATIQESATVIDFRQFIGIGVILDTDHEIPALARYTTIKRGMEGNGYI